MDDADIKAALDIAWADETFVHAVRNSIASGIDLTRPINWKPLPEPTVKGPTIHPLTMSELMC